MVQNSLCLLVVIAMVKEGGRHIGLMKNKVKVGNQKEMFLLCCVADLPRVKEKRW